MAEMTEREYRAIINRQRRLPAMLDAARRRLVALENEARRNRMFELLNDAGEPVPTQAKRECER